MTFPALEAISPIDGRYRKASENLSAYFSEASLIKYRVYIEVEYFIALCELPLPQLESFPKEKYTDLRKLYREFTIEDAQKAKDIEKQINHDVKAVEYFLKEHFENLGISDYKEFIHFGLTSQDINNTAQPYALRAAWYDVMLPVYEELTEQLSSLAEEWKDVPMLARTHGQAASPTTLGKELYVFVDRLKVQMDQFYSVSFSAKFGGATGNFNAHHVAYPEIDWVGFADEFVFRTLGLSRSQVTTQIDHYDNISAIFDTYSRINNILIDLSRDIWTYISMDYFKQKIKAGETGSSTMPHKVNPIDFENAEGNLGMANAVYGFLSQKLPISRLQRDLTDSTVSRNFGVPMAHTLISFKSLIRGLNKLILNEDKLQKDLEENYAVVAEAIQTILRRENYPNPYEALKSLTRSNEKITQDSIERFINDLDIDDSIKAELRAITPEKYTGIIDFDKNTDE